MLELFYDYYEIESKVHYQLLTQGNATMILLKGNDKESLLAARTYIHRKFLEQDKVKKELWINDILKLQKQLDLFVNEFDNIQAHSTCNTEKMKERGTRVNVFRKTNYILQDY